MLHFELSEFDSPDEIGSGSRMQSSTLQMLDDARGIAGVPFRINSGFRSKHTMLTLEEANTRAIATVMQSTYTAPTQEVDGLSSTLAACWIQ